jgi:hypothetical protein
VLLVRINDFLDLAFATHKYTAAIVNVLWDYLQHAPHVAVDCETAS